jgi:hypothetical protein
MTGNQPRFVESMTSAVDGGSEGGRLSTSRLPAVLSLYAATLAQDLKRRGLSSGLTSEPAQIDGSWVIRVSCLPDQAEQVPSLWQGHRVMVEVRENEGPGGNG